MDEIKILPLYLFTLNEAKCNWNSLQLLFDAWNYSMNYYEVRGAEKVKKERLHQEQIGGQQEAAGAPSPHISRRRDQTQPGRERQDEQDEKKASRQQSRQD